MSIEDPRLFAIVALMALLLSGPRLVLAQGDTTVRDTSLAAGLTAGEADYEPGRRTLIKRLELNLGFTTMHIGGGVLVDYAMYEQDSASREQFPGSLVSTGKLRDARILVGGKFKTTRPITWQFGLMYDQITEKMIFRQTGIMVAVPEINSNFFIGRAKEGFSMQKVMTGYDGATMERLPFTDATVPLLADGIKWLFYAPSSHVFWNMGMFTDWLSEGQTFSSYNYQYVLRAGWVPKASDSTGTLLHMAMNFRAGDVNGDSLLLKSKPEAFPAPNFITTGKFPAGTAWEIGPEIYFRPGPLLLGLEYYWFKANSPETGNPWFHGGEFIVSWLPTGETRGYKKPGNYLKPVSPARSVIQGGPGAWETVLSVTYSDLNNNAIDGGIFWRITPMINWHMTDNLRLEFAYGYGSLDRFGVLGRTMFFQSRMQFKFY